MVPSLERAEKENYMKEFFFNLIPQMGISDDTSGKKESKLW